MNEMSYDRELVRIDHEIPAANTSCEVLDETSQTRVCPRLLGLHDTVTLPQRQDRRIAASITKTAFTPAKSITQTSREDI